MLTVAQELEQKTRAYWTLSSVWNGRSKQEIATFEALDLCSDLMYGLNPSRPLKRSASCLQDELIAGEPRSPRDVTKVFYLSSNRK